MLRQIIATAVGVLLAAVVLFVVWIKLSAWTEREKDRWRQIANSQQPIALHSL